MYCYELLDTKIQFSLWNLVFWQQLKYHSSPGHACFGEPYIHLARLDLESHFSTTTQVPDCRRNEKAKSMPCQIAAHLICLTPATTSREPKDQMVLINKWFLQATLTHFWTSCFSVKLTPRPARVVWKSTCKDQQRCWITTKGTQTIGLLLVVLTNDEQSERIRNTTNPGEQRRNSRTLDVLLIVSICEMWGRRPNAHLSRGNAQHLATHFWTNITYYITVTGFQSIKKQSFNLSRTK